MKIHFLTWFVVIPAIIIIILSLIQIFIWWPVQNFAFLLITPVIMMFIGCCYGITLEVFEENSKKSKIKPTRLLKKED